MPADKHYDVVIVGGGPVGMGLAIEIGQRGHSVAVIERHRTPQPIPKGQNLTQRSAEHFHFWGCERELRAARTVSRDVSTGGLVCYGTLLGGYHYDWMHRAQVRAYYFSDNERLPQYATETVLRTRAASIPAIAIHYGVTATAIAQAGDGVAVAVEDDTGARLVVRGRYAVGCDGSSSRVRDGAGITQTRSDHDLLMVLLVFRSPELHRLLSVLPERSIYNALHPRLDGYWQFFGRVDRDSEWFFHAPVPRGTTKDNFDFAALLHTGVGQPFEFELKHVGFWDLRFAIADSYRAGRIFVAGDAAHSHPPYGGYGINIGFEDARNLGWKLSAVLEGWGSAGLLDSYDAERRPVFASTARDFIGDFIEEDRRFLARYAPEKNRAEFEAAWSARNAGASEVMAYEPNYEGSPIVVGSAGTSSARGRHTFETRAGHHLAPVVLADGSNIYSHFGASFALVALDAPPEATRAFQQAATALGLPLTTIESDDGPDQAKYKSRLVLVRPDQFVAWSGNELPGDPAAILSRAIGAQ